MGKYSVSFGRGVRRGGLEFRACIRHWEKLVGWESRNWIEVGPVQINTFSEFFVSAPLLG